MLRRAATATLLAAAACGQARGDAQAERAAAAHSAMRAAVENHIKRHSAHPERREHHSPPLGEMLIPRLISQTGPPNPARWSEQFRRANGSWQRLHPRWRYSFWNDSEVFLAQYDANPNMEAFVSRHFEWFLPAWRRLCFFIMRLDVAR